MAGIELLRAEQGVTVRSYAECTPANISGRLVWGLARKSVTDLLDFCDHYLQQLTEISVRHRVRLPSSLALVGKAFGQMQLAAAELDPSLDPFSVAGSFYLHQLLGSMRAVADPARLFYEGQKLRVRAARLLEGLERTVGVRGGTGLQVDFRGARDLTAAIGLAGRRIAVGLAAATAIVGTAVTASAAHSAAWTTAVFGTAAVMLTGGLLIDVLRRR